MKKADKKLLDDSLSKALAPRRPRQDLDAILGEYDDDKGIPSASLAPIPTSIPAAIPESIPKKASAPETFTYLDATHTASEKSVYSVMYRETVAKNQPERHFGPAELMKKTGIRSRNTVHKALYGLQEKLSVEVVAEASGNPLGPRYRVYRWQDIEQRRKSAGIVIDPQSKRITSIPTGIPATIPDAPPKSWDSGIPESGIPGIPENGMVISNEVLNSQRAKPDDEASRLASALSQAERELTGKNGAKGEQWDELASVLITELRIAAGRTTVSSVPAFLAEHLRRRLWKLDKARLDASGGAVEARERASGGGAEHKVDASQCPDCYGTGLRYHGGDYANGVERCPHDKLSPDPDS